MNPSDLILALFNARTAAHIAHLQTKSYAAHKALGEFYLGVITLADRFAETWMGLSGEAIKFTGTSFKVEKDPVTMLKNLRTVVAEARGKCEHDHLKQVLDDLLELIDTTSYLLTLK